MDKIDWLKTIPLDFDGTITTDNSYPDPPQHMRSGMDKCCRRLKEQGYYIIIHSCRLTPPNDVEKQKKIIFDFCLQNNIPFDAMWTGQGKPIGICYVDDRSVQPHEFMHLVLNGYFDRVNAESVERYFQERDREEEEEE